MDSSEPKPTKRIISEATVVRAAQGTSDPSRMLSDSLAIIAGQIERIRIKAAHSTLSKDEATTLLNYVKGLVDIAKEEREREKSDKVAKELAEMSTEELMKLAAEKLKK